MVPHKYLEVFVDGLSQYFAHLDISDSSSKTRSFEIGTPYLLSKSEASGLDYTGAIAVSGENYGQVFFSASSSLLKLILLVYGATSLTEDKHKDIVGEVANTIAGNARRVLGSNFNISTPTVVKGSILEDRYDFSQLCFVLPVRWKSNQAQLIVNLEKRPVLH